MTNVLNLIAGEWVGEAATERRNPARPDEVVATAPASTVHDVEEAVAAAATAQRGWAALSPVQRGSVLLDAADLLRQRIEQVARDLVREEGKTLAEATGEVRRAVDILRFFGAGGWRPTGESLPSAFPCTTVLTRNEPLGVVGLVTPWNFPIAIPAWKAAPALIAGNSVVLKPAELTPLAVTHLARALAEAGLPAGVLNVVHGPGSTVGNALVRHPDVAGISFTGSTTVGRQIQDVVNGRRARVQLEMGGKNAYLPARSGPATGSTHRPRWAPSCRRSSSPRTCPRSMPRPRPGSTPVTRWPTPPGRCSPRSCSPASTTTLRWHGRRCSARWSRWSTWRTTRTGWRRSTTPATG
jgi:aldehyde dehydrogenase (NAD+)